MRRSKRIDELFGVWAMQEQRAQKLLELVRGMNLQVHIEASQAQAMDGGGGNGANATYEVRDGVAIICIDGVMTKSGAGDSLTQTCSTALVRRQIRNARNDAAVSAMLLHIDSPGGSAAGMDDLAREIAAARKEKPVVAFVEDCGCSAAYYAASQATRVIANHSAFIGCIGTYMVIDDKSKMYEADGIKTHVIRAGAYKGMGTPGTVVTPEHITEMQREVDSFNALFLSAVAIGRRMDMERVTAIADGRSHIATDAKALGLIDEIETFDAAIGFAKSAATTKRGSLMASQNESAPKAGVCTLPNGDTDDTMDAAACEEAGGKYTPAEPAESGGQATAQRARKSKAATVAECKALAPGASADFVLSCVERGMTADEVRAANAERLTAENAALNERLKAANESLAAAQTAASAQAPAVPTTASAASDAADTSDATLKAQWEGNAALRAEFLDYKDFAAFERNKGRISIVGRKLA